MSKKEKAWVLYENLRNDIKSQSFFYLNIGEKLKIIRDEKLYLHLGEGGADTFNDFIQNAEIGLRPSTAYLYIGVYEEYILRLGMSREEVSQIPLNRLMRLKTVVKELEEEQAVETVRDLGVLTNFDYDIEATERGYREFDKPLVYRDKETREWIIEYDCNNTKKIIEYNSQLIIYEKDVQLQTDNGDS
jgi:hypothetical protein